MENNRETILLADDDDALREMYTAALSQEFEVLAAANGKEAEKLLKENYAKIKIALLDVVMPEMDGFDVIKVIRGNSKYKHIPVITLTSLSDFEDRKEALSLGADRFFIKSDRIPSQLVKEVKEVLEQHK